MSADVKTLFEAFDRGVISRRHLLQALGMAVAMRPAAALAQGQCGGANKGTPGCETTPAKLPFEPTGWKTVMLDHLACQVVDYPKEAAYYQALMNWKVRSDDGKQAVLDIGDWGGLVLRGGYVAPPPPATPAGAQSAPGAQGAGRGGGAPRAPRNAAFDGMAWGIDQWDGKKVEAALKSRGLSPVADNHGDYQSFHVKDSRTASMSDHQRQPQDPPHDPGQRQDLGASAVRIHHLEDGVARSHLVRGDRL